jgi:hypothetical protein
VDEEEWIEGCSRREVDGEECWRGVDEGEWMERSGERKVDGWERKEV